MEKIPQTLAALWAADPFSIASDSNGSDPGRRDALKSSSPTLCGGRPSRRKRFISVVVPVQNEEMFLKKTLGSLKTSPQKEYEIIVVTDGCTDQTWRLAREKCGQVIRLAQKGLNHARNLGGRCARGEILMFLETEQLPDASVLAHIAEHFSPEDAIASVPGRSEEAPLPERLCCSWHNALHHLAWHEEASGILICWKKDFQAVGGFNEALATCGTTDLIRRLRPLGHYRCLKTAPTLTPRVRPASTKVGFLEWLHFWMQLECRPADITRSLQGF